MTLEIVSIIVLIAGAVYGYRSGIINQAGNVAGLIIGILLARVMGEKLATFFAGDSAVEPIDHAAAYAVIFVIAYILTVLVADIVKRTAKVLQMRTVDRIAGLVFGAFLWVFILSVGLNVYFAAKEGRKKPDSFVATAVLDFAPATMGYLQKM